MYSQHRRSLEGLVAWQHKREIFIIVEVYDLKIRTNHSCLTAPESTTKYKKLINRMQVDCILLLSLLCTHICTNIPAHTHVHMNVRTHMHARTSTHRALEGLSAMLKETSAIISGGVEDLTGNPLVV